MNKYVGFDGLDDIKRSFESDCDGLTDDEVIFASYGSACYDGDAIVLMQRDGKLYTCEHGHCSCNGLEGGWDMVETTKAILKQREFYPEYHAEFIQFLEGFLK